MKHDEFYIGYLPKAPGTLSGFLRRTVITLAAAASVIALLLVLGQAPFPTATFEFGDFKPWEGTLIRAGGVPVLLTASSSMPVLLVAPGKHGFTEGAHGRRVRIEGSRITRDGLTMLEVKPQSLQAIGEGQALARTEPVMATLYGEIADSKCYLGVMNPGQGKVHRDCAVRCISGGVPPLLIASDGRRVVLLNTGDIRDYIGQQVKLDGRLSQWGDMWVMDEVRTSYK
ncbi:MAG: hypothetical protein HY820_44610 [Acidobacteria bacterium]|nr:hypothetical protein [Acidobacteriota bacterium]